MPTIDIRHRHEKTPEQVHASIERVAESLSERFGVEFHWEEDHVCFERAGVRGAIAVEPGEVHVTAELGFLLLALKGPIEAEVHRFLDLEFGSEQST
ncbi:MAG TPA: polyhydroxyalkanoic acid system family protein [Xanthomonadaceae bacterium]|nr:polyhydroxyalkanoic acid system family protein [Xanthomonadaceae bacterium]